MTETVTVPAEPAGVVAVIEVAVSAVMVAAVEPKSTGVAPDRLVPVMVTEVPPAVVPEVGEILVMVGAAGGGATVLPLPVPLSGTSSGP